MRGLKLFAAGGKLLGRSFSIVEDGVQRRAMEAAGFVDIKEQNFKGPLGTWPKDPLLKEAGNCTWTALDGDVEGYVLYMATMLGWSREQTIVYAAHLRSEARNPDIHSFYHMKAVFGRKPEA